MIRRIAVVLCVMLLLGAQAHAGDFSPTLLKLYAHSYQPYDFDGSPLKMPVDVRGTSAGMAFCVFTSGRAGQVEGVRNGYLGWHYVNKVDTCIYYSYLNNFESGINILEWSGKDSDGAVVFPGEYRYYLWAYDNVGQKKRVADFTSTGEFLETGPDGLPLQNPVFYGKDWRWTVGDDPNDRSLRAITTIPMPAGWECMGAPLIDMHDPDYFFLAAGNDAENAGAIQRWRFVADGDAVLDESFGQSGFPDSFPRAGGGSPGVTGDGSYLYTADENHENDAGPDADFYIYDYAGKQAGTIDLSPWWSDTASQAAGGQLNAGPTTLFARNGMVFLNSHTSCLNQMVDPKRFLESGDTGDFVVWENGNGDVTGDKNFEETAELKWLCNDPAAGPFKNTFVADGNLFSMFNAYDAGAVSFGLFAPDGTGLGYYAYAGDTAKEKFSTKIIDGGTPFDGLYPDYIREYNPYKIADHPLDKPYTMFIAHDSITGYISSNVDFFGPKYRISMPKTCAPGSRFVAEVQVAYGEAADFIIEWTPREYATVTAVERGNALMGNFTIVTDIENDNGCLSVDVTSKNGIDAVVMSELVRITFAVSADAPSGTVIACDFADIRRIDGTVPSTPPTSLGDEIIVEGDTAIGHHAPLAFSLGQNRPNPFNLVTTIPFTLSEPGHVTMKIYAVNGAVVATLADGAYPAGKHTVEWNASGQASGVYFCRLTCGNYRDTIKLTVVK